MNSECVRRVMNVFKNNKILYIYIYKLILIHQNNASCGGIQINTIS